MFTENENKLRTLFAPCKTAEAIYETLLDLGKKQKPLDPASKTDEHLVKGCQSRLYLETTYQKGLFYFQTEADALISAGIAQTLVVLYTGLEGKEILLHKPDILIELGITRNLSISRSNGLASLDLKMRQDVLRQLAAQL